MGSGTDDWGVVADDFRDLSHQIWSYRAFYIVWVLVFFMKKEILVSLGDSRLKEVAEVLGSKSCIKILDLLALRDLTVSDISRELGMKLNTCDYNVKKLVRSGLIEKSGHWWSVKGKKMPVYQVVDRKIVISPKRKIAKKFLWILSLTGAFSLFIRYSIFDAQKREMGSALPTAINSVAFDGAKMLYDGGSASEGVFRSIGDGFFGSLAGWEWFLLGAWGAIALFFIYSLISEKQNGSLLR